MSADVAPLPPFEGVVRPEWLDANDHMNVAYYVLAFDHATDALYTHVGVGPDYIAGENKTMFALESHVTYQGELRGGDPFVVTTRVLDVDGKRVHYFSRMVHGETGALAATAEWLAIHVDLATRRSAPFPDAARARLEALRDAGADEAWPPEVGRVIGLGAKAVKPGRT